MDGYQDMARENKIKLTSGGLPYMASPLIATADDEARQEYLAPIESLQRSICR